MEGESLRRVRKIRDMEAKEWVETRKKTDREWYEVSCQEDMGVHKCQHEIKEGEETAGSQGVTRKVESTTR